MSDETTIPLFPCTSLDETLAFYRVLGFEVTYEQETPYVYGAVRRGGIDLHFHRPKGPDAKKVFAMCLVMVPAVEPYHRAFSDTLREKYGKVPTAGHPRISRLRKGQGRFSVVDPTGNSLLFIQQDEPDVDWSTYKEQSRLATAIDTAANLRDMQGNDAAAAKVLDAALARKEAGAPIDRARALAARAELALALGDEERARAVRAELKRIALSDEERKRFRDELQAADRLEQWRN